MAEDVNLFEAAQRMIERYGDDVLAQIDGRIHELGQPETENQDALEIWDQMRAAVVAILEGPAGKALH